MIWDVGNVFIQRAKERKNAADFAPRTELRRHFFQNMTGGTNPISEAHLWTLGENQLRDGDG